MDIVEKARQHFPLETTGQPFQTHELQRIKVVREMADEIERLRGNMYQAMHHAAEIWKENGQELDDQLGVVALILANGLGIISDAALKEGK